MKPRFFYCIVFPFVICVPPAWESFKVIAKNALSQATSDTESDFHGGMLRELGILNQLSMGISFARF